MAKQDVLDQISLAKAHAQIVKNVDSLSFALKTAVRNLGLTINGKEGVKEKANEIRDFAEALKPAKRNFTGNSADWAQLFDEYKAKGFKLIEDFESLIESLEIRERTGGGTADEIIELTFKDGNNEAIVMSSNKVANLWLADGSNRTDVESKGVSFVDSLKGFLTRNGYVYVPSELMTDAHMIYHVAKDVRKSIIQPYKAKNPDGRKSSERLPGAPDDAPETETESEDTSEE